MTSNGELKIKVLSWVLCIFGTIFLTIVSLGMPFILPKFQAVFKDLGLLLPGLTTYAISLTEYNAWILVLLLSLVHCMLEIKYNGDKIRLWVNVAYVILGITLVGLLSLSILLPIIKIIEQLSIQ